MANGRATRAIHPPRQEREHMGYLRMIALLATALCILTVVLALSLGEPGARLGPVEVSLLLAIGAAFCLLVALVKLRARTTGDLAPSPSLQIMDGFSRQR